MPRWDRYEKHTYEKDLETRKEVQGFGFYKVNRKPGYASLSPEREGKNTEPLGTLVQSVEIQGHVPPPQIEEKRRLVCGTKANFR